MPPLILSLLFSLAAPQADLTAALPPVDDDVTPGLSVELEPEVLQRVLGASPLPPLPDSPGNVLADVEAAAEFGQRLFSDTRLSGYQSISCAGCHPASRDFTNGSMSFRGHEGLRRRTPSLVNVAFYEWFGQDGRADSLWAQALGPLEDIGEHDTSRVQVAHVIANDPAYVESYTALFGELPDLSALPEWGKPVPYHTKHRHHKAWLEMSDEARLATGTVFSNVGKAMEAYERRLVSGPAPFDRFVEGLRDNDESKLAALDVSEQRGMALFFGKANCASCHSGPTFTDNGFHNTRVPVIEPDRPDPARTLGIAKLRASEFTTWGPFADAPVEAPDLGDADSQFGRWRTASLRVPSHRGFTHEHSLMGLADVIEHYSTLEHATPLPTGQSSEVEPLNLSAPEQADLVAFLGTLIGEDPPARWLRSTMR